MDSDGVRIRGVDGAVDALRAWVLVDVRVVGVEVAVDDGIIGPADDVEVMVGV